jgi:hypothetical protein
MGNALIEKLFLTQGLRWAIPNFLFVPLFSVLHKTLGQALDLPSTSMLTLAKKTFTINEVSRDL